MSELTKEVARIEITDELIAMNKKYQKLCIMEEKYEELIELAESVYGIESKQVKELEKAKEKIWNESYAIFKKVQENVFLSRMFKGAMMMKAIKEVEQETA